MSISDNIKNDLSIEMNPEWIFQKHVIDGASYFFTNEYESPYTEYELRQSIAEVTNSNINDVIIIGSAKLGFSVKTHEFHSFDHKYNITQKLRDKSDIDIALINRAYFDTVAEQIYHLSCHFDKDWIAKNWQKNHFDNQKSRDLFKLYTQYVTRGWLRPDFMPNIYIDTADWKNPCNAWRTKLKRKISIGIYSNWTYLKHYHMDNLKTLQSKLYSKDI